MSAHTFDASEIELRRKLLREELDLLEADKIKNLGSMQVVDYHHPERSPGWPVYNRNDPRNDWPQLLYHPTEKDPRVEQQRLGLRRRNEANPNLAPMDIPPSEPLTIKVANPAEKKAAIALGYEALSPGRQMIDGNSPLEVIGRATSNPLPVAAEQSRVDVARILELNAMTRDALVSQAEQLGVDVRSEMTKADLISAIAYAPAEYESQG
jgi:hypothetical protein